ncbi:MAG: PEP-CTERM sorting domain-containing protein, partial [Acidobacteriota bacterium]
FSLGSNLLADHFMFINMVQIGGIQSGNDYPNNFALVQTLAGTTLTMAGKSDEAGGGWTSPSGQITQGTFVWNGSGVITHISIKAGNFFTLFVLTDPLNPCDSQEVIQSQIRNPTNNDFLAISHITGYTGTTSVPEPATLMLLGLGLVAVPLTKKFTS